MTGGGGCVCECLTQLIDSLAASPGPLPSCEYIWVQEVHTVQYVVEMNVSLSQRFQK